MSFICFLLKFSVPSGQTSVEISAMTLVPDIGRDDAAQQVTLALDVAIGVQHDIRRFMKVPASSNTPLTAARSICNTDTCL